MIFPSVYFHSLRSVVYKTSTCCIKSLKVAALTGMSIKNGGYNETKLLPEK